MKIKFYQLKKDKMESDDENEIDTEELELYLICDWHRPYSKGSVHNTSNRDCIICDGYTKPDKGYYVCQYCFNSGKYKQNLKHDEKKRLKSRSMCYFCEKNMACNTCGRYDYTNYSLCHCGNIICYSEELSCWFYCSCCKKRTCSICFAGCWLCGGGCKWCIQINDLGENLERCKQCNNHRLI